MKKSWIIFLCPAMIAGGLVFAGCSLRSAGEPEVRSTGTAIQWKRSNETEWHDPVALSGLMGADGADGKDGALQYNLVKGNSYPMVDTLYCSLTATALN